MDIQDCISIDEARGVVDIILPRAFALLPRDMPGKMAERLQGEWPNVPDRIHDAATEMITGIVRQRVPRANSFRFIGPKRGGFAAGQGGQVAGGGAGGADPEVLIQ